MTTTKQRPSSFFLAYIGEVVSILIFLSLGQVLIQLVLFSQHNTSATATLVHQQELKSQKLLRNALLLFSLDNKIHAEALKELKVDVPAWEASHHVLEGLVFNNLPRAQQEAIRMHYLAMDVGLHTLLADEAKTYPSNVAREKAESPALIAVFYHEIPNIQALDAVYTAINERADNLNTLTRVIEIMLYLLAVSFLGLGYVFIIRPVRRREKEQDALLLAARTKRDDIL